MKVKFFILITVFLMLFAACDKKMKWENENDLNADIYGKCEEGSHQCYGPYISLVCRKGKWENFEDCSKKRACVEETGMCVPEESGDIYYGDENGTYLENNRIVVKLAWKQGFKSKLDAQFDEGVAVDLDLHLVKMNSIEAELYGFERTDGLLGTNMKKKSLPCAEEDLTCERYWRHDDCSAFDNGKMSDDIEETIAWGAAFGIDNTWGGGNYQNPETVFMGSTKDTDGDGTPDVMIPDDQYLVVATYGGCVSNYRYGADRCDEAYQGDGAAYEVDARLTIFVDGEEVPRAAAADRPADHYYETSKDFKIRLNEWKVVAVIKWDNSLKGSGANPESQGNAVVSDIIMPEEDIELDSVRYPVCVYQTTDAVLVPVWNEEDYVNFVTLPDETGACLGTCRQPEEPEPYEGDKRKKECEGLVPGADWNTVSEIIQEWDGEKWLPSSSGVYNVEESSTECHFKCRKNYSWNGTECAADTRQAACEGLPEHAEWFSVSEITQTWNGSEWLPSVTATNCHNSSTEYCCFKCNEHYEWKTDNSCEPETRSVECTGKPDGATWNNSIIVQTWDEEAGDYLPSSEASYYDGNNAPGNTCTFRCSNYYEWINSECLENPCLPDNPCEGIENSDEQCVLFVGEGYLDYSCDCYDGYYWNGETCAKECNPDTCFKTHTCSGVVGGLIEMTGTAEGHGTCNSTNGSCECDPGWLTGTSSSGTGTTVQCESAGFIFETLNNVECAVCDISNPPSEYATKGCPQSLTGDTTLCSATDSTFCGQNGTCYYEPAGEHRLYCVCGDGYHLDNGDKYTGFCESDGDI